MCVIGLVKLIVDAHTLSNIFRGSAKYYMIMQRVCMSVCLYVCLLEYPKNHMSKCHEIFCACCLCLWPWLGWSSCNGDAVRCVLPALWMTHSVWIVVLSLQEFRNLKCSVVCLSTLALISRRKTNRRRWTIQATQRPARQASYYRHRTSTSVIGGVIAEWHGSMYPCMSIPAWSLPLAASRSNDCQCLQWCTQQTKQRLFIMLCESCWINKRCFLDVPRC